MGGGGAEGRGGGGGGPAGARSGRQHAAAGRLAGGRGRQAPRRPARPPVRPPALQPPALTRRRTQNAPRPRPTRPPIKKDFAKAGANMFTFHLEAAADPAVLSAAAPHPAVVELAEAVRAAGMQVGAPSARGRGRAAAAGGRRRARRGRAPLQRRAGPGPCSHARLPLFSVLRPFPVSPPPLPGGHRAEAADAGGAGVPLRGGRPRGHGGRAGVAGSIPARVRRLFAPRARPRARHAAAAGPRPPRWGAARSRAHASQRPSPRAPSPTNPTRNTPGTPPPPPAAAAGPRAHREPRLWRPEVHGRRRGREVRAAAPQVPGAAHPGGKSARRAARTRGARAAAVRAETHGAAGALSGRLRRRAPLLPNPLQHALARGASPAPRSTAASRRRRLTRSPRRAQT
jgi:hypothetical protein